MVLLQSNKYFCNVLFTGEIRVKGSHNSSNSFQMSGVMYLLRGGGGKELHLLMRERVSFHPHSIKTQAYAHLNHN